MPKEQERRMDLQKPSPPLRTHVPTNIFYPFVTSDANKRISGFRSSGIATLAVLTILATSGLL